MNGGGEVLIGGVRAEVASGLWARMKGLIGRKGLPRGQGLLIPRCNAIHTFFMRFAIDAVFYDRNDRVVKTVRGIRPWRPFVWGGFRAVKVLETESAAGEGRGIYGTMSETEDEGEAER